MIHSLGINQDELDTILTAGGLAPSAGNMQPWRFCLDDGCLLCRDRSYGRWNFLDFKGGATYLTFGGVAENMSLAASRLGLCCTVDFVGGNGGDTVFKASFTRSTGEVQAHLIDAIDKRACNRRPGDGRPIGDDCRRAMEEAVAHHGAQLILFEDRSAMTALGELMGTVERMMIFNRHCHRAMMSEICWSHEEAVRDGFGMDIATMEMPAAMQMAFKTMRHWPVVTILRWLGGGRAIEKPAQDAVSGASAIGIITAPGVDSASYFQAGRAMQRLWLAVTACGAWLHPMATLPYFTAHRERGDGAGLSKDEWSALGAIRDRYREIVPEHEGCEAMLFRILYDAPPSYLSVRLKSSELIEA